MSRLGLEHSAINRLAITTIPGITHQLLTAVTDQQTADGLKRLAEECEARAARAERHEKSPEQ